MHACVRIYAYVQRHAHVYVYTQNYMYIIYMYIYPTARPKRLFELTYAHPQLGRVSGCANPIFSVPAARPLGSGAGEGREGREGRAGRAGRDARDARDARDGRDGREGREGRDRLQIHLFSTLVTFLPPKTMNIFSIILFPLAETLCAPTTRRQNRDSKVARLLSRVA